MTRWALSSALLFVLGLLWSVGVPLGSAPDEGQHVIRAAAVVRGQIVGPPSAGQPPVFVRVKVPDTFAAAATVGSCYNRKSSVPAGCAPAIPHSGRTVTTAIYVGRYPPLYHALVGIPTLLLHSAAGIRLMRAVSALLSSLLLGLAIAAAATWSRSRLLVVAVGVTITPMVLFLSGVINPSGLEISAAIATWTCSLVLVMDHAERPPPGLVTAAAASCCVLELTRALSVFWAGLIAVTLLVLAPRNAIRLFQARAVRRALLATSAIGVVAVLFVLSARSFLLLPFGQPIPPDVSNTRMGILALARFGGEIGYLHQIVGVFGSLDTPAPQLTMVIWTVAIGALVLIALTAAPRRGAYCLLALIAASVVIPTMITLSHGRTDGLVWQARDGFPLYAGIPLLAAVVLGDRSHALGHRAVPVIAGGLAVGHFAAFIWALRRYTVGIGPVINPFANVPGGWQPPIPAIILAAVAAIAATLYGGTLAALSPHAPAAGQSRGEGDQADAPSLVDLRA